MSNSTSDTDQPATQTTAAAQTDDRPWLDPDAKPFIQIRSLSKDFGDFAAVDGIDLDIYKGELFTILGGSGCGKSTLLRMLAGFETPSGGQILIDGIDMTSMPPYQRPVNMMFQSYAVFPHMSVAQNIAYGLKKEGVAKSEIDSRVGDALEMVQLSEFAERKPDQLSGGQRQRVALARALIKRPKVLLLDEPLAALDKKLREQTQFELMNIQDQLGITFVVVTHDQEEAMTLATRIAVMDKGRFVQTGTPSEVYEFPRNRFVADFFGTINLFAGSVVDCIEEGNRFLVSVELDADGDRIYAHHPESLECGRAVAIGVRPEKIHISQTPPDDSAITQTRGVVEDLAYYGNRSVYRVRSLASEQVIQVSAQNYQRSAELVLEWDDEVYLSWDVSCSAVLTE